MSDLKLFPCRFCGSIPDVHESFIRCIKCWNEVKFPASDICYSEEYKQPIISEAWNARNEKFNPFLAILIKDNVTENSGYLVFPFKDAWY